jgi:DNA-binding CsgD family transcriptional regulator
MRSRGKSISQEADSPENPRLNDLPDYLRRMLGRVFVFPGDLRGYLREHVPASEARLPLSEMIRRNQEQATKCFHRSLQHPQVNFFDLFTYPEENPIRWLDSSGEESVLEALIDDRVLRHVFKRHRTALDVIHERLGDDEGEVRDQIICSLGDQAKMEKAVTKSFRTAGDGIGMLRKITERRLIDRYRRAKRLPGLNPLPLEIEDPVAQQALDAIENDNSQAFALARFTKKQRELAAIMIDLGTDYSDEQAANRLGITRRAVWKRRRSMRRQLIGKNASPPSQ